MPLFEKTALRDGVAPREAFAWALFDAANSGYSTVVLTAVFNAYFVSQLQTNVAQSAPAQTVETK